MLCSTSKRSEQPSPCLPQTSRHSQAYFVSSSVACSTAMNSDWPCLTLPWRMKHLRKQSLSSCARSCETKSNLLLVSMTFLCTPSSLTPAWRFAFRWSSIINLFFFFCVCVCQDTSKPPEQKPHPGRASPLPHQPLGRQYTRPDQVHARSFFQS